MKKTSRKIALVTGASRGIGRAVALELSEKGFDLALVSRTGGKKLDAVAGLCRKKGARVFAAKSDLAQPGAADFLISEISLILGKLDALVHCVGDYHESTLKDLAVDEWQNLFRSNLDSAFYVSRAALGPMRDRKWGRIVFLGMAGISSLRPRRDCAAYAAAKTALLVYARSLALEEAQNGITVNVVSPGAIPHEDAHPSAHRKSLLSKIPAGRFGKPEEVASAISFLLSKEAGYITGADLPVSGGWML